MFTNSSRDEANRAAERVNRAFAEGRPAWVSNRKVASRCGAAPAVVWGSGSVSFSVEGQRPGAFGTVWVKPDTSVEVRFH